MNAGVGIIVQARMTSVRLPGKVLKEVLGKPLLEIQLERLAKAAEAQIVLVATTVNVEDNAIAALCQKTNTRFYRGSEEDVLSRFYETAARHRLKTIVRVTSDCPLIDPKIVDAIIKEYRFGAFDYVSNTVTRSFPRGMDTEVFSFEALRQIYLEAEEKPEREHVTPFIYRRPERFKIRQIVHPEDLSRHRWTVDTEEDFELIRNILETLYPKKREFTMGDCLELLKKHPEWTNINSRVRQKTYGE